MPINYQAIARLQAERRARELAHENRERFLDGYHTEFNREPTPEQLRPPRVVYKPRAVPGSWSVELDRSIVALRRAQLLVEAREARLAREIVRGQRAGATLRQIAEMCCARGFVLSHQSVANLLARVKARR